MDVEQHGAGSVGVVGDVGHAVGQLPDEPGVYGAEQQAAGLRLFPGALHMVQNPFDFGGGKVGVNQKAGALLNVIHQLRVLHQLLADAGGAAALPHNGVVNGQARLLVPHNGGFPLVGDADAGDLLPVDIQPGEGFHQHAVLGHVDVGGVVLYPAGLGVNLRELLLRHRNDILFPVEHNAPAAGGALVQGYNIFLFHTVLSILSPSFQRKRAAQQSRTLAVPLSVSSHAFCFLCYHAGQAGVKGRTGGIS